MAGSLQPRTKVWSATEDVSHTDLNTQFDSVLEADQPLLIDDYSTNTTQMQVTADPGEVGTESLATTLAGELARLRHMIGEITGEDQWYESPISSLAGLSNAIGTGLTDNRLVSGRVRTTSEQPTFLVPNGAAATVKLDGTPTSFIYYVNGTEYSIATDVTLSGLTTAPSSNNTCLVNDTVAADQYWTKIAGEDGGEIPVDTMGTEISALVGKFAGFKLNNGAETEYFMAYVKSSTSLTKVRRGYFFDSSDAPIPRVSYANNDTITLMKLTWVFAKTDGTLTATYTNPTWSDDEPSSPAVNDYWFDYSANKWKVYGVGSFSDANAILVGVCLQDTSNCVAARSFEFFKGYESLNTVELFAESNTQVKSRYPGSSINVWGLTYKNDHGLHTWDMTLDLESGVTEAASTYYYFYVTEDGDKIISDKKPFDRREDLQGYYHPHNSWRCVGQAFNDGSSNLTEVESYFRRYPASTVRSHAGADIIQVLDQTNVLSGTTATFYLPPAHLYKGRDVMVVHDGTSLTQVYTITAYGTQTINIGGTSGTTMGLYTKGETRVFRSSGANWYQTMGSTATDWIDAGTITIGATTTPPTKATGIGVDKIQWRRIGNCAHIRLDYRQTNTTSAAAGTGDYLFAIPSGMTMDTSLMVLDTAAEGGTAWVASNVLGAAHHGVSTANGTGIAVAYDSTQFRIMSQNNGGQGVASAGYQSLTATNVQFGANIIVPISGWKP